MLRSLVVILIAGAFLGGYHLGHSEGSPDLTGWAQKAYPKVVQAGREIVAAVSAEMKAAEAAKPAADPAKPAADASKPAADEGDLYRAATEAVQKQVQAHPEWDPRYWNAQTPQPPQP